MSEGAGGGGGGGGPGACEINRPASSRTRTAAGVSKGDTGEHAISADD